MAQTEVGAREARRSTTISLTGVFSVLAVASACSSSSVHPSNESGGPSTLAPDDYPFDLAVDDEFVYWTAQGPKPGVSAEGAVRRMRKDGSGAVETLASNLAAPNRIVLDESYVYWTNSGLTNQPGSVMRVEKTGGAPVELATGLAIPVGIGLHDGSLYFSSVDVEGTPAQNPVYELPVGPTPTKPKLLGHVPYDAGVIAPTADGVWGVSRGSGAVWRLPYTATEPDVVDSELANPTAITATDIGVVVAEFAVHAKVVLFKTGMTTPSPIADEQDRCGDVAADSSHIYWASFGAGEIWREQFAAGSPERVLANEPNANGVVVDADAVYFARYGPDDGSSGMVRRLGKAK